MPDRSPSDPRGVLNRAAEDPDAVLRWAAHDDGLADVFLPPARPGSGPAPLLVALHGGFWRQEFDRRHIRPLARDLSSRGWVVVLPEYARTGGPRSAGDTSPWSLVVEDLRGMRRRVPELLAEVAPGRADAGAPVLLGHSAGGQLALWWALDAAGEPERQLRPRHVVALAPVADLQRATTDRLGADAVPALFGGAGAAQPPEPGANPDVAARLRAGQRPTGCRLVLLHGVDDAQVPVAHSTELAADVPAVEVRTLPGVEHFALIDPLSAAWPDVLAALPPPLPPPAPPPGRPPSPPG